MYGEGKSKRKKRLRAYLRRFSHCNEFIFVFNLTPIRLSMITRSGGTTSLPA